MEDGGGKPQGVRGSSHVLSRLHLVFLVDRVNTLMTRVIVITYRLSGMNHQVNIEKHGLENPWVSLGNGSAHDGFSV